MFDLKMGLTETAADAAEPASPKASSVASAASLPGQDANTLMCLSLLN
jgi:hypothetical protein